MICEMVSVRWEICDNKKGDQRILTMGQWCCILTYQQAKPRGSGTLELEIHEVKTIGKLERLCELRTYLLRLQVGKKVLEVFVAGIYVAIFLTLIAMKWF